MSVRAGVAAALVCLLLSLLAACAWVIFTLYLGHRLPWMAWPLGAALGWTFARGDRSDALVGAVAASIATLLAAVWVALLVTVAVIAGSMGVGLLATVTTAGPGMLISLAWMAQSMTTMAWLLSGAVLAALVAWARSRALRHRAS